MLDLKAEILTRKLIPQQAGTVTITGASLAVNDLDGGDLDFAQLMITGIVGVGTVTVKLQGSATGTGGWADLPTTPAMPSTSFAAVAADLPDPVRLPVDPRGLQPFIRAVATVAGITNFVIECFLACRSVQSGFPSTSG